MKYFGVFSLPVPVVGFEPLILVLWVERSTTVPPTHNFLKYIWEKIVKKSFPLPPIFDRCVPLRERLILVALVRKSNYSPNAYFFSPIKNPNNQFSKTCDLLMECFGMSLNPVCIFTVPHFGVTYERVQWARVFVPDKHYFHMFLFGMS